MYGSRNINLPVFGQNFAILVLVGQVVQGSVQGRLVVQQGNAEIQGRENSLGVSFELIGVDIVATNRGEQFAGGFGVVERAVRREVAR